MRRLASDMRENPSIPPSPENPSHSLDRVMDGVLWPLAHCAIRGCSWTGDSVVSLERHIHLDHRALFWNCQSDAFDFYCAAVEERERQGMPPLGVSRDRRVIRTLLNEYNDENVMALVCFCCAQVHTTTHASGTSEGRCAEVQYVLLERLLAVDMHVLEYTFGLERFLRHFPNPAPGYSGPPGSRYPSPDAPAHPWIRTLRWWANGMGQELRVLCCPEDVRHCGRHTEEGEVICSSCSVPLCAECYHQLLRPPGRIPSLSIANDNFIGYVSDLWAQWQPTWIEVAAATPVWTVMMSFYVEEDKGHLLGEKLFAQTARACFRGNIVSYHMPWEYIYETLLTVVSDDELRTLPHDEEVLSHLVRFQVKVSGADIADHL